MTPSHANNHQSIKNNKSSRPNLTPLSANNQSERRLSDQMIKLNDALGLIDSEDNLNKRSKNEAESKEDSFTNSDIEILNKVDSIKKERIEDDDSENDADKL